MGDKDLPQGMRELSAPKGGGAMNKTLAENRAIFWEKNLKVRLCKLCGTYSVSSERTPATDWKEVAKCWLCGRVQEE